MLENETIPEDAHADRLRTGDEAAFHYVMNRYFAVITSFAKRLMHNQAAAEDVAVETFIKLWQNHAGVGNFQSIKAFLFITARNACFNELRKEKNKERKHNVFAASQDQAEWIDQEIIRAEVKAEIYKAVDLLPKKMKRVFQLGFIEGLPNREIARMLDLSVNTVKAQKSRALELVKEQLQGKDILPTVVTLVLFLQ